MKEFLKIIFKKVIVDALAESLVFIMLCVLMIMALGTTKTYILNNLDQIKELQRSHEVLYRRVDILKNITCGQCHDAVPDEWGRHDGEVKLIACTDCHELIEEIKEECPQDCKERKIIK